MVRDRVNNISAISWQSVYCWRKLEYPGKTQTSHWHIR